MIKVFFMKELTLALSSNFQNLRETVQNKLIACLAYYRFNVILIYYFSALRKQI